MGELILIGLGAALMYFLDPTSGRHRRLWLREQWGHVAKKSTEATSAITTEPRHPAPEQRVAPPSSGSSAPPPPADSMLGDRVQGSRAAGEAEDPAKKVQP